MIFHTPLENSTFEMKWTSFYGFIISKNISIPFFYGFNNRNRLWRKLIFIWNTSKLGSSNTQKFPYFLLIQYGYIQPHYYVRASCSPFLDLSFYSPSTFGFDWQQSSTDAKAAASLAILSYQVFAFVPIC